jgi:CDP-glucose 4,6-dehydratase
VFGDFYRGKTVLVTGHTGFKGSWLCTWLLHLGAKPIGYALAPPSDPSNFAVSRLAGRMVDLRADVRDRAELEAAIDRYRPQLIFHLAAQALVRPSFEDPAVTFETNLMGTVNVLDVARSCPSLEAVICITSDKCYENQEWIWGYRETDKLGGHEPYGVSKACAELAIAVYQDPRFQKRANPDRQDPVPIVSTRAGNVIGGGDWATDRLVPDIVRSIAGNQDIVIRCPGATRPWQHVLEAVSGYLWLGKRLAENPRSVARSYNFGPQLTAHGVPVAQIVERMLAAWQGTQSKLVIQADQSGAESALLRLDCSRADHDLGWTAAWDVDETVRQIVDWYRAYYQDPESDMFDRSVRQIETYIQAAREKDLAWTVA